MKWTISSLYLLVFISLLGFGWAIDKVYETYLDDSSDPIVSHKVVFASILKQLNKEISSGDEDSYRLPDLFQLDPLEEYPLPDTLEQRLKKGELIILESEQGLSLHQKLTHSTYVLGFGPIPDNNARANTLEFSLTIIFYLGIALMLVIWITPLVKSVQTISSAAKQVGNGNLNTRLNPKAFYLSDLNRDFNVMVERLNTLSDTNQLFSQAVSHDLRSPLARITFALEKLSTDNNPNQTPTIEEIHQDIDYIESLTTELLDYARLEKTRALQSDSIDLHVFLQQLVGELSHSSGDIDLIISEDTDWSYLVDSRLFHKVMRNLIQNAMTYAQDKVAISVLKKATEIEIVVEDDGSGIEPSLLEEVFKPFNQGNRQSEHHFGLGLAICQRTVNLLGGFISADNNSTIGGARITVRLTV